jgi:hypothetical protein
MIKFGIYSINLQRYKKEHKSAKKIAESNIKMTETAQKRYNCLPFA